MEYGRGVVYMNQKVFGLKNCENGGCERNLRSERRVYEGYLRIAGYEPKFPKSDIYSEGFSFLKES
jgi:hypothetical protein